MKAKKKRTSHQGAPDVNPLYKNVLQAFARTRGVVRENRKGFGFGALKVNGKIFALMSSQGKFVVKIPEERAKELVACGDGEYFAPKPGRPMKQWVEVRSREANWTDLAREAYRFVKNPQVEA